MKANWAELCGVAALFLAPVLLLTGVAVGSAYGEARAYRRITGQEVSVWDALFVELRVDCQPRPQNQGQDSTDE